MLTIVAAPVSAADWPQWRGPDRSGVSSETGLLTAWPEGGPKLRWKRTDLGTGYSSVSVVAGKVYTQTTKGEEEFAAALDEATGKTLWTTKIGQVGKNQGPQYPGTRATPTVDGDRLYCLASDSELVCLTTAGKIVWQKNLKKDLDGKVGFWAYTESILIDGDKLICTPGGDTATLAALNKMTGSVIWKSAVPGNDLADYASIMPVVAGGRKQYVQYLRKALVGVDAETGQYLWKYTKTQDPGASILTPVVKENRVFISGSRAGGAVIELIPNNSGVEVKELFFDKNVAPSLGGAVLIDGHLYGSTTTSLFCVEFATGRTKWTDRSVGAASICAAGGKLYVRGYNTGEIALVDASPAGYKENGRFKYPDKSKIQGWSHPVVANGGLYIRDQDTLLCYDVNAVK